MESATMKNTIIILLLAISFRAISQEENKITTFILIRHAEKVGDGSKDPDLKPEGIERANKLISVLRNAAVTAIYSTNYKRTRNTVAPLSKEKGVEVQLYESLSVEAINQMLEKNRGGTIVVCGHSNTIPWIANQLIGKEEYKDFSDPEYGNMLIVSVLEKGNARVTWINY
jgi:2,3-bisphosphoglycerate-dependent phosphoglycerate mutase